MGMPDTAHLAQARGMLRDMVHCQDYRELSARLGFVPASSEVEEIEHRDSHFRCESLLPIVPQILDAASSAGMLLNALSGGDEETVEDTVDAARRVCVGVIARLVDHSYLEVAK